MIYHRITDGATVDAERWDGTPDTALEIESMLGVVCNRTVDGTLMLLSGGALVPIRRGSWVVKSKTGWVQVPDGDFRGRYR
jgi:hypothetical protein